MTLRTAGGSLQYIFRKKKLLDFHFKYKSLGWENERTVVSPWCSATTVSVPNLGGYKSLAYGPSH